MHELSTAQKWGGLFLRLGLGFTMFYAGFGKLFMGAGQQLPIEKIVWFLPRETSLALLALVELVLGILLLIGLITRIAGWATAVLFAGFIVSAFILGLFNMTFSNIGFLGAALWLALQGCHWLGLDCYLRKM